ncbi:hypothetical protein PENTCL1PPCAC_3618 [Pristionchus entomophagus]|uniref:Serpentine receptor class gamma n=1 Tax=Pristionchus entomophagus TaxID=358040 RepID=A0AAV5SGW9_9BILA|nr:hypothetical protein PENTCL1PPCAC_3618 [Pristionchus entomophagus]
MFFYSFFSVINLLFSLLTLIFVAILHTSRDQMLHTPFYSLFKVNAFYGVANLVFRLDFGIFCIEDPNLIIVITVISHIGIIAFCIGNFYIEVLRYSIVRKPVQDEQAFSRPKLYLLWLFQLLLPSVVVLTAMKPGVAADYEGCLYLEEDDRTTAILMLVHSAYALPAIVLSLLIVRKLRRIKQTSMSEAIATGKQDHLVWYTVACAVVQVCKCISILTRSVFLLAHMEGAHQISKSIVFPMNIFYINSPTLLLIYFSSNVRRRLFYMAMRKTDTGVYSLTTGKMAS